MAKPPQKRISPLVRKSISFPFQVSVACWIDLLGYGRMIAEADFNPLHPKSKDALRRLRQFHQIIASHSNRQFPTLVMNDGAVAYRDLSLRSRSVTHDFLTRSWKLFKDIRTREEAHGYPGARLVLGCGFRMRGRGAGIDAANKHFQSLVSRLESGEIDASQAIHEAASVRPTFDIVPQLQANFAFTKAYVAESSGEQGGLRGPNFYVDIVLFASSTPDWLVLGPEIPWSHQRLGMQATFASVLDIVQCRHPEGGPIDILDGLQVAQRLAGDPDVLAALRTARTS